MLVKISAQSDPAAVQETAKALQDVGKAAGDTKAPVEELGTKVEFFEKEQLKELRTGIKGLTAGLPGVGHELRALLNPTSALAMGIGFLISEITRAAKETASGPGVFGGLHAELNAMQMALNSISVEGFKGKIDEAEKSTGGLVKRLQESLGLMRAIRQAEAEAVHGQLAIELAKVDAAEEAGKEGKPGGITGVQAAIERQKIKGRLLEAGARVQLDALADEKRKKEEEIENAKGSENAPANTSQLSGH